MSGFIEPLMKHFTDIVLVTASRLQTWVVESAQDNSLVEKKPCASFAEELLKCSQHLPPARVRHINAVSKYPFLIMTLC